MTHRYMDAGTDHDAERAEYAAEYAAEVAAERAEHAGDVRARLAASARQLAEAARHLDGTDRAEVMDAARRIGAVAGVRAWLGADPGDYAATVLAPALVTVAPDLAAALATAGPAVSAGYAQLSDPSAAEVGCTAAGAPHQQMAAHWHHATAEHGPHWHHGRNPLTHNEKPTTQPTVDTPTTSA